MWDAALLKRIESLVDERGEFCVVTIVDGRGSIPQVIGARAVFNREGLLCGTVGGGRLETHCKHVAAELLAGDDGIRHRFERLNLLTDVGMTCAGEVSLYFEMHRPDLDWHVVVFGAGHVAQKLCRFLVELDCRVVCIDTRPEWLERLPRSETLETVQVTEFAQGVERIQAHSSVLVMTMGHLSDKPVLHAIASGGLDLPFLGVIGSKSKAHILKRELRDEAVPAEFIDRIVCPVGDKVGNNTPAEIAVGIVSQLVRSRRLPQRRADTSQRSVEAAWQ